MAVIQEDQEVIRVSQWAEIRQLHLGDGVGKKEIARRLCLDVKTVRRAILQEQAPLRRSSPSRGRLLDPHRDQILLWLRQEPRITAKRIGRLLEPALGRVPRRTVRKYVADLRQEHFPREAFVRRMHLPGETMEVDFGETVARISGELVRLKYMVATLPASNARFAKAYRMERLECLMDGIVEAFRHFGGLTKRLVLDNTSLAVKRVLKGPERIEHKAFQAFRGAFPVGVDFCAPAAGWEKGSVEGDVGYVRENCFVPMADQESDAALNAMILREIDQDLDRLKHPDGGTVRAALEEERKQLRPLPRFMPDTCRIQAVVANKFGEVRVDRSSYTVPNEYAYRSMVAKLYHDRIEVLHRDCLLATHPRSQKAGKRVIDPRHVLSLLERKSRAVSESESLLRWDLPEVFTILRTELHQRTRKADREWVQVLQLLEQHPEQLVEEAVGEALSRGSPRLDTIRLLVRQAVSPVPVVEAVKIDDCSPLSVSLATPRLGAYDDLLVLGARS